MEPEVIAFYYNTLPHCSASLFTLTALGISNNKNKNLSALTQ